MTEVARTPGAGGDPQSRSAAAQGESTQHESTRGESTQGGPIQGAPTLALATEFDQADRAEWQRLVSGVLAKTGALPEGFDGPPESLLTTTTYDGIEIQPLYTASDAAPDAGYPGLAPFVRGRRPEGNVVTGWDVRARHGHADARAVNREVLADLEGGVTSVWLRVGRGGVTVEQIADALHEVRLDLAPVTLEAGADYVAAAEALLAVHAEHGVPDGEVGGVLGADPIGLHARTGTAHDLAPAADLAARVAARYPLLRTVVADGLPFHQAGGSDAQELGATIAAGVAYLRALTDAGLDVDTAAAQLEFRFAATADQFLTIAKLRAARRLWARVAEVSGASETGAAMRQHAVTSPAMFTRRDPWVNMLRTTIACFAAGVAGVDAVTVLPFDDALGRPEELSLRVARNTQSILQEETKLAGVVDPAGGSWYVEKLTDELAHAAWDEFTSIEKAGGITAELESGALAARLAETWNARSARIATRKDPITGVSEFPAADEELLEREPSGSGGLTGGLPRVRYAQEYEALRDSADAHRAATGARPKAFLATLGTLAQHTARATFAANFLQAGGIEPVNPGQADGTDDVVARFRDSATPVAILCGADATYADQAAEVSAALRQAGATQVWLAGRVPDGVDAATFDGTIHIGCDVLAALTGILGELGVTIQPAGATDSGAKDSGAMDGVAR
ncbi:methylmalonyl-CoA mutase family protein [Prauserella rugosa]|uniref:Methylmalonyl-CoA mutase n=1 Tax=Prauserella rugosa TaxID=43354 RepID=A0A660CKF6_9PSEU|nr:methylmalonyl-CoA mutase family protein [Prauserella rugosa]TWH22367.1 methylmalonyl-CoA mutase [Prauserella rugosa]